MLFILGALVLEHRLCQSTDLARINAAFFNMNALVGLFLVAGVGASLAWPHLGALGEIVNRIQAP
jgi:hypothetical protein